VKHQSAFHFLRSEVQLSNTVNCGSLPSTKVRAILPQIPLDLVCIQAARNLAEIHSADAASGHKLHSRRICTQVFGSSAKVTQEVTTKMLFPLVPTRSSSPRGFV
jgi:hypothetical protein